jgi:hypothetical protein
MAQFGLRLGKGPPTSPVDIVRVAELIGGADVAADVAISRAVAAGGKREVVTAGRGLRTKDELAGVLNAI